MYRDGLGLRRGGAVFVRVKVLDNIGLMSFTRFPEVKFGRSG